jgi:hypothetical protein
MFRGLATTAGGFDLESCDIEASWARKNYQHRDASHGSFSGFAAVRLHRRADNQCRRRKHHELIGVISNLDIFNETEARLRSISFVFVYHRVAFDEQWQRKTI